MSIFRRKPKPKPVVVEADRSWCVAQDLRPFGFRVDESGLTEREAAMRAARSPYLRPVRHEAALAYNRLSASDSIFFEDELHAYTKRQAER